MAYYAIFDVTITDLAKYKEYMQKVKPVIEAGGGRYLVRGGAHRVLEGDWSPTRLVVLEFPSPTWSSSRVPRDANPSPGAGRATRNLSR
jgi:uncharacterized protein (DUF1330 family)